jgi:hypothetical protein
MERKQVKNMNFSVYAKRKVGFDSIIETIKFTKDGTEFHLNKEQVDEMQAVLAGKRFCLNFFQTKSDYSPYQVILCSSENGEQLNATTFDDESDS